MSISETTGNLEVIKQDLGKVAGTAREGYGRSSNLVDTLKDLSKIVDKLSTEKAATGLEAVYAVSKAGEEQARDANNKLASELEGFESEHAQNALKISHYVAGLMGQEHFTEGQGIQVSLGELGSDIDEIQGLIGALQTKLGVATKKALRISYDFIDIGGESWKDRMIDSLLPVSGPPLIEKGEDWIAKAQTEVTIVQQEINR